MLAEITIDNLGVIPRATAEFSPGLTVLTGETGAGKTMVVTGLRLLTGGRADASRIRTGADKAGVEGRFLATGLGESVVAHLGEVLDNAGGSPDENGDFLVSRSISAASGRSRAHLGGRSVPAATLAEFAQGLLTIHGQNDQLRLVSPDEQRAALDRFDPAIAPLREAYAVAYRTWRKLARDLKRRTESRRELAQEVDRLEFALAEIDKVDPAPGEDTELIATVRRLQDVDGLREQASLALGSIDGAEALGESGGFGEDAGAADLLGRAHAALAGADPQLAALAERIAAITAELTEISGELGAFLSDLPTDPGALEQALTRQQDLKSLTRKYAADIDGVLAWREKARTRLASIDTSAEALDELRRRTAAAKQEMQAAATELTAARVAAAGRLADAVTAELHGLAMPKARLIVEVRPSAAPGPTGADDVELLLAPGPKAQGRPLATAASGGELSRVMLALEVILAAATSSGTTLVFDEVDAGVGGRAAVEIGRRLARLATRNQVIVVTHLPQVAAYADTHLNVAKEVTDEDAVSGVETLTGPRRVEELARMLAGLADTDTGRAHAAELLERAQAEAAEFRAVDPRA